MPQFTFLFKLHKTMLLSLLLLFRTVEGIGVGSNIVDCSQCFAQQWEWTAWQCSVQCQHDEGTVTPYGEYNAVTHKKP